MAARAPVLRSAARASQLRSKHVGHAASARLTPLSDYNRNVLYVDHSIVVYVETSLVIRSIRIAVWIGIISREAPVGGDCLHVQRIYPPTLVEIVAGA